MCGINGANGSVTTIVAAMNRATAHRGPDQTGVSSEAGAVIGNNRLAIIDLSENGRQPMTSADGRYTIVFNGEIYNYNTLRSELQIQGVIFRSKSDTEVILEGYAMWGRKIVDRLRGMWAFCIRDNREQELFLCRDPFGIKPLYLFDAHGIIAFSSEIKGLLAHSSIPREMDPDAVRDLLLLGYILAPRTILKNVIALLPGEERRLSLTSSKRSSQIVPLAFDASRASRPPSDDELLSILEDSVAHHLIADVPVGLFFSGGMDSTLLASIVSRIHPGMRAYHVAIEGREDTRYARSIANELKFDLVEIPFHATDVPLMFDRLWNAMDQPFADTSFLPTLVVSRRAVQDVKVVLSGEGGDELFVGYPRHARMSGLLADATYHRNGLTQRVWHGFLAHVPSVIRYASFVEGGLRFLAKDLPSSFIAETSIGASVMSDAGAMKTIIHRLEQREHPDGALAFDRLIYLPDDLLSKIDIATMACSLEGRVPFLDREVFANVAAAPLSWKRDGGLSKAPFRRLLKRLVPAALIDRPKSGFSVPLSTYLLEHEREEMRESVLWYLNEMSGLAPAFDATLRWGMRRSSQFDELSRSLGYVLYAVHTLHRFSKRLSL